jgi:hypothetical protein
MFWPDQMLVPWTDFKISPWFWTIEIIMTQSSVVSGSPDSL